MNRRTFFSWITALAVTRIPEAKGDGVALQSIPHPNIRGHHFGVMQHCAKCGISAEDAVERDSHTCPRYKHIRYGLSIPVTRE